MTHSYTHSDGQVNCMNGKVCAKITEDNLEFHLR